MTFEYSVLLTDDRIYKPDRVKNVYYSDGGFVKVHLEDGARLTLPSHMVQEVRRVPEQQP